VCIFNPLTELRGTGRFAGFRRWTRKSQFPVEELAFFHSSVDEFIRVRGLQAHHRSRNHEGPTGQNSRGSVPGQNNFATALSNCGSARQGRSNFGSVALGQSSFLTAPSNLGSERSNFVVPPSNRGLAGNRNAIRFSRVENNFAAQDNSGSVLSNRGSAPNNSAALSNCGLERCSAEARRND
jgi:hypothetical protein